MKPFFSILVLFAVGLLPIQAQLPVWVTSDAPTDELLSGNSMMPWEIWKYDGLGYTLALSVPGRPDLSAIHKLDTPGDWLFSVESTSNLGGALPTFAEPHDLILYRSGTGTYQLCVPGSALGIPSTSSIDSIHMDGGDLGDLILGFDVPTDVVGFPGSFEPADLARFNAIGLGLCAGWTIAAANPDFDASATLPPPGIGAVTNVDGADGIPGRRIVAFDVPTDAGPFVGPAAFVPGRLAQWNASALVWQSLVTLGAWPIESLVDGVSCGGTTPGRVDPPTMVLGKVASPSTDIVLTWPGSCASGAQDYGIYEGTIGSWYSHGAILCTDVAPKLNESITPSSGNRYYLVVPLNACNQSEGSYGRCSAGKCLSGDERPPGTAVCAAPQVLPTPPACP